LTAPPFLAPGVAAHRAEFAIAVAYYPYLCAFTVCVNCRSVALLALRTFSNASRACKLKARMSLSAFHVDRRMQLWIACATGMDRNIHLGELRRAPWNNRPGDPFELAPPQRSSPRCNRPSPRRDDRQFLGHNRRSAIGGGASAAGWFAAIRKLASENCSSHCQRMSLPDPLPSFVPAPLDDSFQDTCGHRCQRAGRRVLVHLGFIGPVGEPRRVVSSVRACP